MDSNAASDNPPRMAVRRRGSGRDVVLFHGGMGSWRHWTRNIDVLAARFTVHALDHPSYGDSATVARETTGAAYLDLVHRLFVEMFPGDAPLRLAGFSFGGAIAASLARRLAPRVTHLCLVSPGGFRPGGSASGRSGATRRRATTSGSSARSAVTTCS